MNEWISFFTTWIFVTLSVIAIYESVKRITLGKHTFKLFLILGVAVVFLVGRAGFVYWGIAQ